jgi:hypothetical protein
VKPTEGSAALSTEVAAAIERATRQLLMSKNSGCLFVRNFAHLEDGPIDFMFASAKLETLYGVLDGAFDDAAARSHAAIVLFPYVENVDQLVDLLGALSEGDRWSMREVRWRQEPTPDLLVGIDWRTSKDQRSSVMGLAPFLSMPVYRRTHHVALALWPGGHENEHWPPKDAGRVGLVDMPTGMTKAKHDSVKGESSASTAALRALPGSFAAQPNVAFCLPPSTRERLVAECKMMPLAR